MNALILTGENQYGVVDHFLSGMSADLKLLGYNTDTLRVNSQENIDRGITSLRPLNEYDLIVSFNGVGLGRLTTNYNTLEYAQHNPVYVFCVDHPIHILPRFFGQPVTVLCVDKEHAEFMRLVSMKSHYFPHAISHSLQTRYKMTQQQDKKDRILFPVSYLDKQNIRTSLEPVWHQISQVVENVTSVTQFLIAIGVIPSQTSPARIVFDENIRRISTLVDKYIRASERENCIKACEQQGLKLTLIGRNVARYKSISTFHEYLDTCTFDNLLSMMSTSAFVLHNSPGFEQGLHERLIYPLAHGTPVITWKTPYIDNLFANNGVYPYTAPKPIFTSADYNTVRLTARNKVLNENTWLQNLRQLLSHPAMAI